MAIGAYVTAIVTSPVEMRDSVYYMNGIVGWLHDLHAPMVVALLIGGLFAAAAAALIGIPILRLKSDYLAIATLGFAEIIRAFLAAPMMDQITNGSYGLNNIPGFKNIFQPVALAVICIGIMVLLINSSYGRAFKAIREDDIAAEAMGINLFHHKELSFVISSFFTGIAGGMLAIYMRSIDTKTFQVMLTYNILLIVVLGGIGNLRGSMIATIILYALPELLRGFANYRMLIYAIVLIVMMVFNWAPAARNRRAQIMEKIKGTKNKKEAA